jgi:N-acetylneuraminic acid mutarotase
MGLRFNLIQRLSRVLLVIAFVVGFVAGPAFAQAGSWASTSRMPTPRSEVTAATIGTTVFVAGGGVGGALRSLESFDATTGTWQARSPMPLGLTHAGSAAYDGKFYVFGGLDEAGRPSGASFVYDPATDAWQSLAALPIPRGSPGVAVLGDKIYVVGGIAGRNTPATDIFDPATGNWTEGPDLNVARDHFALVSVAGRLVAAGGRIGNFSRNVDVVEVLEPGGSWRLVSAMPAPRSGIGGAEIGGTVYVFGGEDPAITNAEVFAYNPATDSWSTATPMPTARHGIGVAAVGGSIIVIGGGLNPGGGSDTDLVEMFTP